MVEWFKKRPLPSTQPISKPSGARTATAPPPSPPSPARRPVLLSTPPRRPRRVKRPPEYDLPEYIGHYRVVSWLGQGGMSEVYQVEFADADSTQRYALKRLVRLENDEEAYQRFMREIQICNKLHHPNVCRMFDWNIEPDHTAYIVMELLEGEVLSDFIEREAPLTVDQARPIVRQMLEGLEAIHLAGVVHRDLKPGNVFLTRSGALKIMDFGIARKAGMKSLTQAGSALGTPEFISPEQIIDTHLVDERTDLFNVGLILYEMLTTTLPFRSDSLGEMLRRLVQGAATPISDYRDDLSPDLMAWLNRLLAKNRERRFQSTREALNEITW